MEEQHTGKGNEGEGTGPEVRRLIQKLMDDGMTLEQIGRIANRDVSTMQQIRSGEIKNPPNDLLDRLKKAAARRGV